MNNQHRLRWIASALNGAKPTLVFDPNIHYLPGGRRCICGRTVTNVYVVTSTDSRVELYLGRQCAVTLAAYLTGGLK